MRAWNARLRSTNRLKAAEAAAVIACKLYFTGGNRSVCTIWDVPVIGLIGNLRVCAFLGVKLPAASHHRASFSAILLPTHVDQCPHRRELGERAEFEGCYWAQCEEIGKFRLVLHGNIRSLCFISWAGALVLNIRRRRDS